MYQASSIVAVPGEAGKWKQLSDRHVHIMCSKLMADDARSLLLNALKPADKLQLLLYALDVAETDNIPSLGGRALEQS